MITICVGAIPTIDLIKAKHKFVVEISRRTVFWLKGSVKFTFPSCYFSFLLDFGVESRPHRDAESGYYYRANESSSLVVVFCGHSPPPVPWLRGVSKAP
jgi:hypothetical protein